MIPISPLWPRRAVNMKHSEYVLGRVANKLAYEAGAPFTVTCFAVSRNRRMFSDPVSLGSKPGPCALYRIKVTPKLPIQEGAMP